MKARAILATVAAFALTLSSGAETEDYGGYTWTYEIYGGTAEIQSGIWPDPTGALTIPSTLGGKPVTSIGDYAFNECSGITSVTIPNSVASIGDGALAGCSGLTSVTIPNNVTSIGVDAFYGCSALTGVTIPNSVTSIGGGALGGCSSLTSVTIPNSVTSIRSFLFYGCFGLKSVTIPNSVTDIGNDAFNGCSSLKSATIPNSVTSIGEKAFSGCSSLTSVTIPNSVTDIGNDAFNGCSSLKSVTIPDSVTSIGEGAFFDCIGLTSVTISDGVTSIGGFAFYDCSGLTSVTIPNSVTNIGAATFQFCTAMTDVYCYADPVALTWSGAGGDFKDDKSTKIHVGAAQLSAYESKFGSSVNATFVSGDGAETVGGYTWSYRLVGGNARIYKDDPSYPGDGTTAVSPNPTGAVTIPSTLGGKTVTGIGYGALYSCNGMTSVTIPAGVTSIGDAAFQYCSGMTSVKIPDSVTSIGWGAFWSCGLTSVTIPATVTSIGASAFYRCTAMADVYCYPAADSLTWGDASDSFKSGKATRIHVRAAQLSAYVAKFGDTVNATFVGDLADETCKVTFGKNGGTGGDNYVTATYGQPMPTPRTAPTLSGYTFGGYWDTLAVDEKGNPKGKQYYDANMKSVRNWDKSSATTLWAKWTNKVTFGKNGGTGGDDFVTCTKGQPMPKRTMPTKTGYVFDGYWTTTGAGGVKYYNADGTSAHAWDKGGSVTLWAKWVTAVSCKVTFGKNGGTGGDDYVTATTGKAMPTPRTAPKRTGWSFGGYWDTLAQDANGNPLGKQYYNSKMESVRAWDKTSAATLWAKWTVRVKLGKNGGTGGDDYVTVIFNQPFPKRTMPKKSGYAFGGYFVSASSKTGQCYNPDGTGTASMKWSTGGSPTIWALWTKTSSCVEVTPPTAAPISSVAPAVVPAGLYSGVLADGTGAFWLMLDEPEEGRDRTAFLYVASEDGLLAEECLVVPSGLGLLLEVGGESLFVLEIGDTGAKLIPVNNS